jgi:predicted nucleotidyltransferase
MSKNRNSNQVAADFYHMLAESLGPELKELWLFGSHARGDALPDSDFDFLVVADGTLSRVKQLVQENEWRCMESFGVLVSSIVYPSHVWAMARHSPLGMNILREGKQVA